MKNLESKEEHSYDITTISLKRSAGWSPSPRKNNTLCYLKQQICIIQYFNTIIIIIV